MGLVALPLAMAFAIASGVGPERGLYTAIVAGFLISALGGSRVQIGGPTGAFVVIVAGIVTKFGFDGLVLATLMAGALLILFGLCRMGSVVKFVPYPVTTGFTSGIAVIIFSSQMKDFFGLQMPFVPIEFLQKWEAYVAYFGTCNPSSVLIGVATVSAIGFWPKSWKVPASVVALILSALTVSFFDLNVDTIGSRFGGIPHGLPALSWPTWSWASVKLLFPSAITVAMLGAIESLLSAVVADGMTGTHHRSDTELIAQGIANLVTPLFGGIPATGAIARTATNVRSGGRTPIAGIVHALVLLLILLTAGPLAAHIPLAALTGVLVVVSYHMLEWRSVKFLLSGPMSDRVVLLVTFFLTVFVDLVVAVEVGMVMAAFLFMRNIADITEVKALSMEESDSDEKEPMRSLPIPAGVEVFSIRGAFFFAAVHKLMQVDQILAKKPRAFILDLTGVLHMDASGLHAIERLRQQMISLGIRFVLVGVQPQPLHVLREAHQLEVFGIDNLKPTLAEAFKNIA